MKSERLISFYGKQEIKDAKIADLKKHRELDNLMQKSYFDRDKQKGCAVTCTMFSPEDFKSLKVNTSDIHGRYETQLGIPRIIARLEDRIFEGMPIDAAKEWPLKFIEAVPVGVNIEHVWRKFMIWLLIDDTAGVIKFTKREDSRQAIRNVAEAFARSLETTVLRDEWWKLRSAAAAADAAAYAAAAADAAAYAAAADAADAADDDADAAGARISAGQQHFILMGEKLVELLKEAK
jgi:hypothetical protein